MRLMQIMLLALGFLAGTSAMAAMGVEQLPKTCSGYTEVTIMATLGGGNVDRVGKLLKQPGCKVKVSNDDATVAFITKAETITCYGAYANSPLGAQCVRTKGSSANLVKT